MKVGIVVPYSWSFWGGVPEHAHHQALALRNLGVETRTLMGNDPPGQFTRVLHPRHGRHGMPPPDVIPIGRSVIVPANGTLPNIILSPRSVYRIKQALERERFDVVHMHEPMTPTPCIATLAMCTAPMVATFHANGELGWYLRSDGSGRPYKVHVRAPGFHILSGVNKMIEGRMLADLVPTFDTINMIGGEVEQ